MERIDNNKGMPIFYRWTGKNMKNVPIQGDHGRNKRTRKDCACNGDFRSRIVHTIVRQDGAFAV